MNDAYKLIHVGTLDEIQRIKKPSKLAFDACRLLCLFVNIFRDCNKKWPVESFSSWVTISHFIIGSPSVSKMCQEIMQIKKVVTKPKMQDTISDQLHLLRSEFLGL